MKELLGSSRCLCRSGRSYRNEGKVPAVIHRKDSKDIAVCFKSNELRNVLKAYGDKTDLKVNLEENFYNVRIIEIQRDAVTHNAIHLNMIEE